MLPSLVRLVQSVRRFADSGLETHLVNVSLLSFFCIMFCLALKLNTRYLTFQAGKYGAGIVYYLCYFVWRHHGEGPIRYQPELLTERMLSYYQGGPHHTPSFVAFCVFGTVNSVYTTTWVSLFW